MTKYCTNYRFRITYPVNQDAAILVLLCDKWQPDDLSIPGKTYIFTTDKEWVEIQPYATLDKLSLPFMKGIDLDNYGKVARLLKDWEEWIVAAVAGFNIRPEDWSDTSDTPVSVPRATTGSDPATTPATKKGK